MKVCDRCRNEITLHTKFDLEIKEHKKPKEGYFEMFKGKINCEFCPKCGKELKSLVEKFISDKKK